MSDRKQGRLENIKQIRALNDPYRQEILSHIRLLGKPSTAKEIAVSMNEAPSKVNYHIKVLEKYNFVEIDHTENINGIIAKYYKRTASQYNISDENGIVSEEKQAAFINMIEQMYETSKSNFVSKVLCAIEEKKEDDNSLQISSSKYYLNEDEINEMNDFLDRISKNSKEGRELYSVFLSFAKED